MKNSFGIPRQGSSSFSLFLAAGCLLLVVVPIAGYSSSGFLLLGTNAFVPGTKAADPAMFNAAIASVEKFGKLKAGVPNCC